tara:strand:- start:509 stop:1225 length:717 start_codon:yes stop_codon:yes gene_type:complete
MNNLINTEQKTMSHIEISELAGKRSDSVKRTMDSLVSKGLILVTQIVEPVRGKDTVTYQVNKRDSYIVMAQVSPEFTAVLVDRWQELEGNQLISLPSPTQLALMVIKAEEEKATAMLEVDRLQGVCNTITAQFATGMTAVKFCKMLNGVNVTKVNGAMKKLNVLQNSSEGLIPTSYSRDKYFKLSYEDYENAKTGKKGRSAKATLTKVGAKWLYRAYLSGKLPMKATWDNSNSHVVFE